MTVLYILEFSLYSSQESRRIFITGKGFAMRAAFYLSASIMTFILVCALFILSFFYDQIFPLIVFGLVFTLLFFFNSWIFSRRISFSVNRLLKRIKELSSGKFPVLSAMKSRDEFGILERDLNQYILNTKNMVQNIYEQS